MTSITDAINKVVIPSLNPSAGVERTVVCCINVIMAQEVTGSQW